MIVCICIVMWLLGTAFFAGVFSEDEQFNDTPIALFWPISVPLLLAYNLGKAFMEDIK